jgi:uncharacterized protein (TIGR02996 family)
VPPTYVVEKAKTGRSACKHCGSLIEEGEQRFGTNSHPKPRWFHLACAAEGAPRAFQDYAKKHKLPAISAPKKTVAKKAKKGRPLDPSMIAAMRADRDDPKPRLVFADWLQADGDPWGEIIALAANDREAEAEKLFKAHRAELEGDFPAKALHWEAGFIRDATIAGKLPQVKQRLRELAGLRATVILEGLSLAVGADDELMTMVSESFPQLDTLFVWQGPLGKLALPVLEELNVWLTDGDGGLDGIYATTKLPKLWSLQLTGSSNLTISAKLVDAIVAAPLFGQLREILFEQLRFGADGKRAILAHKDELKKLGCLGFRLTDLDDDAEVGRAFKKR